MSNENQAIQQLAKDLVTEALDYMGDRQNIPFNDLSQETQSSFLKLQEIDGFIETLNQEINNAELNEKKALAESTLNSLEDFNVAANPELSEAITDYILETTPNEIQGVHEICKDYRIQVRDNSMDRGLRTRNAIHAALKGNFEDAGINYAAKVGNRSAQLAAKALKAQVMLQNKIGGMGG